MRPELERERQAGERGEDGPVVIPKILGEADDEEAAGVDDGRAAYAEDERGRLGIAAGPGDQAQSCVEQEPEPSARERG